MTVRHGREVLSIPGPSQIPDAVLQAMHRPAIEIYSGDLLSVTETLLEDLPKIFQTEHKTYIYAANGHGAWAAAISNIFSRGDKALVLESGRFAPGWGEMAATHGVEIETLDARPRRAVEPAAVEARLRQDTSGEFKAVLVVQVDTASGVVNDIPAIRRAIDAAGHDALLMVDTIASMATMPFQMDDWGVDVAVAAAQKGLMTPPGISFVGVGPRAKAAHQNAELRTTYWDWTARDGDVHYQKYCGTPPEHLLFGLRKAVDMILEEGLSNVFERHRLLSEAVRRAVTVWAEGGALEFNITEPTERANSVTTVLVHGDITSTMIRDYCENKCGVVIGVGIGDLGGKAIRVAHMGHVNAPMVLGTLGAIEMALKALGVPHGSGGVQAAIDYLGSEVRPDQS
jgi:alanine-glyoxylate transaminase/serine-glyoxylate transaminase/serine-pyruvate transaminase